MHFKYPAEALALIQQSGPLDNIVCIEVVMTEGAALWIGTAKAGDESDVLRRRCRTRKGGLPPTAGLN